MSGDGLPPLYALVVYVRSGLGEFIENLRAEVHPPHAHLPTHLSILPPRPLTGGEPQALEHLRLTCARLEPFTVELGDVETFLPTTPTVFIRVAHAGYRMRELHDALNSDGLAYEEPLVYMPHVTIAKLDENEHARRVFEISRREWEEYRGTRTVVVESLTFVRGRGTSWTDLATVELAGVKK